MEPRKTISPHTALILALIAPVAAAAIMIPLRTHTQTSNLALIMVVVVAATVIPGHRFAAPIAGVSAGVWFDFFLTRPYEQFAIHRSADVQTAMLLVVVAILVGEIAARRRRAQDRGEAARQEVLSVYVVAQMLSAAASAPAVTAVVADQLRELLALRSSRFETTTERAQDPLINRAGDLEYGRIEWPVERDGFPNRDVTLPVESEGRRLGRFVLRGPDIGVPVAHERRMVAVALADLAGAALRTDRRAGRPGPFNHAPGL